MEARDLQSDPFADLMAADLTLAPDQAMWLRYSYSTGAARTGVLTPDGLAIVLRDFPLDPFWTSIRTIGDGRLAFHSANTGMLTVGQVSLEGTFADVRNNPQAELAASMMRLVDDTLLFWTVRSGPHGYQSEAVVGRVDPDGTYTRISGPHLWDFWTHVVPVQDGLVLFYNSQTRLAATGRFTGDGGFADLGTFPGFDPWTHIHASADGTLLFYNTTTGSAASGRVEPNGNFTNLFSGFAGPATAFLPTRDGRILVFRGANTLVAKFGGPSGWFSEGRVVNGLITPIPELFVR